ncbi:hypothetical protein FWD07_02770 [Candidatus Saccharibacteria bacterium]|nr:hypothetical protein [Candidatus Saccharibacteria bacterium]
MLTLVDYCHNNITQTDNGKNLADIYPRATKRLIRQHRPFTESEKLAIIADYKQSAMAKELVEKYGRHRANINKILTDHGITLRRINPSTRGKEAEIARLYRSGLSIAKVAKHFGISQTPVVKCLQRQGVEMRAAGRR